MKFTDRLIDVSKPVQGLAPTTPSTSTPDYVSMKAHQRCQVRIEVDNGATVTASAITLKQATAVDGSDEKALAFTEYWKNEDTGAADTMTLTTATSNTFNTVVTNAKNATYILEVDASDLDVANGFDCVRAGTGDAANTVLSVSYTMYGARYSPSIDQAAITD
jgi:hypothetical protein